MCTYNNSLVYLCCLAWPQFWRHSGAQPTELRFQEVPQHHAWKNIIIVVWLLQNWKDQFRRLQRSWLHKRCYAIFTGYGRTCNVTLLERKNKNHFARLLHEVEVPESHSSLWLTSSSRCSMVNFEVVNVVK